MKLDFNEIRIGTRDRLGLYTRGTDQVSGKTWSIVWEKISVPSAEVIDLMAEQVFDLLINEDNLIEN